MENFSFNNKNRSKKEHVSFREYVSLLYDNPRMKIYIQGKMVHTRILKNLLYKPISYEYSSSKFKDRAIREKKNAQELLNDGS